MKIRRFNATDMRDAMQQVSKALGPDAVILESTRTENGVAISAAIDFDPVAYKKTQARKITGTRIDQLDTNMNETDDSAPEDPIVISDEPVVVNATPVAETPEYLTMQAEVKSIRCLLEAQLSRLVWNERERKTPELASVLRNLSSLGLTPDVVNRLAEDVGDTDLTEASWTTPLRQLVKNIPVCDGDLVCDGGIFAVIGPTGVGKTTSIAKLAARYALTHDAADIALVTLDTYKIGAREQLETFGQILNVPVYQATDAESLNDTLRGLTDKKLVLIDTAGMSQRDVKLDGELKVLVDAEQKIDVLLAVPANMQTETLQEVVTTLSVAKPAALILTKIDEAASLGGALSVLMRGDLPLAYVANGQRVPEDLHCASARQAWLVKAAVELMRQENDGASDDYMAKHFGEVA